MIKCYVINLDHRKDRLKKIKRHLNSNGLKFIRFKAVNALETDICTLSKNISVKGPLGNLSIGDMACFQKGGARFLHRFQVAHGNGKRGHVLWLVFPFCFCGIF